MKLPGACLGLVWLALSTATPSRAAPYAHRGIRAPAVLLQELTLTGGQHYLLTTTAAAGVDPMMHVLNASRVELARDDDGAGGMQPRIDFVPPSSGKYTVVVHAYSIASGGTGTFFVNGTAVASNAYFGGFTQVVLGSPTASRYVYETALRPDGTAQTTLFPIDCAGKMLTFDMRGGVGVQSRIANVPNVCRMLVAADNGLVNLYVNDTTTDADGDGLGSGLEAEIGTCDSKSQASPSYCAQVVNTDDTDRDGLTDMAEVFGIDNASQPQYLPKWGANPLHKDAFVEIDWTGDGPNPFTPIAAYTVSQFYRAGSVGDLFNRDGQAGIAMHFDLGVDPPFAGSETIINTTYGNWGGSNRVATAGLDYVSAPDTQRASVRTGVFRYGLVSASAGGGQGFADRFGCGIDPGTVAHELGHTLGLTHWGHDKWGGKDTSCKPNYPSLMNYSFRGQAAFSQGALTSVINPANTNEGIGIGGSPETLAGDPWFFDNAWPGLPSVSFNRDGKFFNANARTGAGWAPNGGCSALTANAAMLSQSGPLSSPDLVRVGSFLYAFYAGWDGSLKYRYSAVELDGGRGGCPLGDNLGQTCTGWAPELTVPIANPRSDNIIVGVSAATLGTGVQLAFRDAANNLRLIQSNVTPPGPDPSPLNGPLGGWGSDTTLVQNVASDPELSPVSLSLTRFDSTSGLGLFYSDGTGYRWRVRTATGTSWLDQGPILRKDGSALLGTIGVGVSPFPGWGSVDPGTSYATMCGAFVLSTGGVDMFCYDKTLHQWADLWRGFEKGVASAVKPSLAYHVFRDSSGRPLTGDIERGQFWLGLIPEKRTDYNPFETHHEPRVMVSRPLDARSTPWVGGVGGLEPQNGVFWPGWAGIVGNVWSVAGGTGMSLYEDARLTALKGLWLRIKSYDGDTRFENWIEFLPLADGTARTDMRDGDDFQVMERGLCMGLRNDTDFCGTLNSWGY